MKGAVCTICTEQFECFHTVSALKCGHIFHAECVSVWLNQSMTCPQCRQKVIRANIIQKLFFSRPDGDDSILGEPNPSVELARLSSKLEESQNKLCIQDREMSKLLAEKMAISDRIDQLTESHRSLETLHRRELDNNKLLRQQLTQAQSAARQLTEAQKDSVALRKKVTELQNVQSVINGCQEDIDSLIRQTSDAAQLATWCTVYKAELARKRTECNGLTESLRRARRDLEQLQAKHSNQSTELNIATGRVATLEEDIAAQNKEIAGLRKKLEALESALGSPSDTAAGLARRLIRESPAPSSQLFTTPKLSGQPGDALIDLDTSADLFVTPNPPRKRPRNDCDQPQRPEDVFCPSSTERKSTTTFQAAGSALVRKPMAGNAARSFVGKPTAGMACTLRNISNKPAASNGGVVKFSFKDSVKFSESSSVFREGYNGFGGHEKVVMPPARPQQRYDVSKKLVIGGSKKQFFGPSKTGPAPPLPSLDGSD